MYICLAMRNIPTVQIAVDDDDYFSPFSLIICQHYIRHIWILISVISTIIIKYEFFNIYKDMSHVNINIM